MSRLENSYLCFIWLWFPQGYRRQLWLCFSPAMAWSQQHLTSRIDPVSREMMSLNGAVELNATLPSSTTTEHPLKVRKRLSFWSYRVFCNRWRMVPTPWRLHTSCSLFLQQLLQLFAVHSVDWWKLFSCFTPISNSMRSFVLLTTSSGASRKCLYPKCMILMSLSSIQPLSYLTILECHYSYNHTSQFKFILWYEGCNILLLLLAHVSFSLETRTYLL